MSVAMEASAAPALSVPVEGRRLRVVHLTTSYPRHEGDYAGRFVADLVRGLAGHLDVSVLAPGGYRDFGLAYGRGLVGNLRRRPWLAPLLVVSMILAVRGAASRRDLVHAHWLAAGAICVLARRRFVLTLHGSGTAGRFADLELARRHPRLFGFVVRRAEVVIGVAGDGPLRHLVPGALGFVPHDDLGALYGRAAVVVCPSYREGLPLCVLEAMAHGRPVVATAVGGIPEFVEDGVTGYLVEPGDVAGLRAAIERLLADPLLRRRMGREARKRVTERCSWDRVTAATLSAYT